MNIFLLKVFRTGLKLPDKLNGHVFIKVNNTICLVISANNCSPYPSWNFKYFIGLGLPKAHRQKIHRDVGKIVTVAAVCLVGTTAAVPTGNFFRNCTYFPVIIMNFRSDVTTHASSWHLWRIICILSSLCLIVPQCLYVRTEVANMQTMQTHRMMA